MKFKFEAKKWQHWLLLLLMIAILIEFFRDIFGTGDFVGYINAGNNVINQKDIYGDYLNTWPPLFSIFSVPLALLDNFNGILTRAIWLGATLIALFWIIKVSVALVLNKQLFLPFQITDNQSQITFDSTLILLPFLFIFRYVLDNMANIQINIFMLAMAMGSLYFFIKNRIALASFWLAVSVSLKVFTIFLIPYYLYKKKWMLVIYTLSWIMALGFIPFLVFGKELALDYYQTFYIERAAPFAMVLHKNQSVFAMFRSLFMEENRGFDIYINWLNLDVHNAKKVSYAIVGILGLGVAYLFRKTNQHNSQYLFIIQTFFVMTAIPILSPLAWKAYFIFLWPGYFWVYLQLWGKINVQTKFTKLSKLLYLLSIIGTVFSSEMFLGGYLSDIFEIYAAITIGTILLLVTFLISYSQFTHKGLTESNLNNLESNQILSSK